MSFLVKNYWTLSAVWAGVLVNHQFWNRQMHWVFKKNSLKPNGASHNNASWYTATGGFLEHLPSGENLDYKGPAPQKKIQVFGVSSLWSNAIKTGLPSPTCSLHLRFKLPVFQPHNQRKRLREYVANFFLKGKTEECQIWYLFMSHW